MTPRTPSHKTQTQIEGLATLLVLDEEIRKLSTVREFGFFSTNETHRLLSYHSAYLWEIKEFIGTHLVAQSGAAEVDIHAPPNQWLLKKIKSIASSDHSKEMHQIEYIPSTETSPLDQEWPDALPKNMLWCPLISKSNHITGGLIFFRETAFNETEIKMLRWLIASYQYTWLNLIRPSRIPSWQRIKEKPYLIAASIFIIGFLLFPVHLSALGDGTVVPKDPVLVNAPLQGVIKQFYVNPGDRVKPGQILLTMDDTDLLASAEVSRRDLLLSQAKLRTAINVGFDNKEASAEIPILNAQIAIDKARLDYANELLAKSVVKSTITGLVIFDSKEDWIGQPVQTGERILLIANPKLVELKITIPIANSIVLAVDDLGEFFPHGQLNPLPIKIKRLSYNAKLLPSKILVYQLGADFSNPTDIPQLGAQGTVKVYGKYVPLIYYLLKRPLQALRQTMGI